MCVSRVQRHAILCICITCEEKIIGFATRHNPGPPSLLSVLVAEKLTTHHVPLEVLKAIGDPLLEDSHAVSVRRTRLACIAPKRSTNQNGE